jgi:hypothetical protein
MIQTQIIIGYPSASATNTNMNPDIIIKNEFECADARLANANYWLANANSSRFISRQMSSCAVQRVKKTLVDLVAHARVGRNDGERCGRRRVDPRPCFLAGRGWAVHCVSVPHHTHNLIRSRAPLRASHSSLHSRGWLCARVPRAGIATAGCRDGFHARAPLPPASLHRAPHAASRRRRRAPRPCAGVRRRPLLLSWGAVRRPGAQGTDPGVQPRPAVFFSCSWMTVCGRGICARLSSVVGFGVVGLLDWRRAGYLLLTTE